MASHPNVANKVELTAVTSTPHEHVEFKWTHRNFKSLVQVATTSTPSDNDDDNVIIATLPFNLRATLFPPGTPQVTMYWKLQVVKKDPLQIGCLLVRKPSPDEDLTLHPLKLYSQMSVRIYKDQLFTQRDKGYTSDRLLNHVTSKPRGRKKFLFLSDINKYVDSEGSLNLKVSADFYVDTDGDAQILPVAGNDISGRQSEVESVKMRKTILLNQMASLLGDNVTSDVIVALHDARIDDMEVVTTFFCHSAILSGRSSVLRDKLKDSKEKKDGKVVLKLEEDVDFEVMDAFLTFIYSGRLKDTRKDNTTPEPIWVEMLPQLVQFCLGL